MSAVHYKFSASKEYSTVTFDGMAISLRDLKLSISAAKKFGRTTDMDLKIFNAQTGEDYINDDDWVPKNTSVIVKRVPASRPNYSLQKQDYAPPTQAAPTNTFTPAVNTTNMTEEEKMKAMINQSAADYQQQDYATFRKRQHGNIDYNKKPPADYTCNRCGKAGHYIRFCPAGEADTTTKKIKKATGIPRSFLKYTDNADQMGTFMTADGQYAIMQPNEREFNKEISRMGPGANNSSEPKPVPPELQCHICTFLLTDCVLIPCCGSNFCDELLKRLLSNQHTLTMIRYYSEPETFAMNEAARKEQKSTGGQSRRNSMGRSRNQDDENYPVEGKRGRSGSPNPRRDRDDRRDKRREQGHSTKKVRGNKYDYPSNQPRMSGQIAGDDVDGSRYTDDSNDGSVNSNTMAKSPNMSMNRNIPNNNNNSNNNNNKSQALSNVSHGNNTFNTNQEFPPHGPSNSGPSNKKGTNKNIGPNGVAQWGSGSAGLNGANFQGKFGPGGSKGPQGPPPENNYYDGPGPGGPVGFNNNRGSNFNNGPMNNQGGPNMNMNNFRGVGGPGNIDDGWMCPPDNGPPHGPGNFNNMGNFGPGQGGPMRGGPNFQGPPELYGDDGFYNDMYNGANNFDGPPMGGPNGPMRGGPIGPNGPMNGPNMGGPRGPFGPNGARGGPMGPPPPNLPMGGHPMGNNGPRGPMRPNGPMNGPIGNNGPNGPNAPMNRNMGGPMGISGPMGGPIDGPMSHNPPIRGPMGGPNGPIMDEDGMWSKGQPIVGPGGHSPRPMGRSPGNLGNHPVGQSLMGSDLGKGVDMRNTVPHKPRSRSRSWSQSRSRSRSRSRSGRHHSSRDTGLRLTSRSRSRSRSRSPVRHSRPNGSNQQEKYERRESSHMASSNVPVLPTTTTTTTAVEGKETEHKERERERDSSRDRDRTREEERGRDSGRKRERAREGRVEERLSKRRDQSREPPLSLPSVSYNDRMKLVDRRPERNADQQRGNDGKDKERERERDSTNRGREREKERRNSNSSGILRERERERERGREREREKEIEGERERGRERERERERDSKGPRRPSIQGHNQSYQEDHLSNHHSFPSNDNRDDRRARAPSPHPLPQERERERERERHESRNPTERRERDGYNNRDSTREPVDIHAHTPTRPAISTSVAEKEILPATSHSPRLTYIDKLSPLSKNKQSRNIIRTGNHGDSRDPIIVSPRPGDKDKESLRLTLREKDNTSSPRLTNPLSGRLAGRLGITNETKDFKKSKDKGQDTGVPLANISQDLRSRLGGRLGGTRDMPISKERRSEAANKHNRVDPIKKDHRVEGGDKRVEPVRNENSPDGTDKRVNSNLKDNRVDGGDKRAEPDRKERMEVRLNGLNDRPVGNDRRDGPGQQEPIRKRAGGPAGPGDSKPITITERRQDDARRSEPNRTLGNDRPIGPNVNDRATRQDRRLEPTRNDKIGGDRQDRRVNPVGKSNRVEPNRNSYNRREGEDRRVESNLSERERSPPGRREEGRGRYREIERGSKIGMERERERGGGSVVQARNHLERGRNHSHNYDDRRSRDERSDIPANKERSRSRSSYSPIKAKNDAPMTIEKPISDTVSATLLDDELPAPPDLIKRCNEPQSPVFYDTAAKRRLSKH
eukprot:Ihof_evm3s252 gene=Ihof_evmTU3s252